MDAKTKLLGALALKPVSTPIKAIGVDVLLRPWGAGERQSFQALVKGQGDTPLPDLYEHLFVRSMCDETGAKLFADEEIVAARQLNGAALEEIAREVIRLNGLEGGDPKAPAPSPTTPS